MRTEEELLAWASEVPLRRKFQRRMLGGKLHEAKGN